MYKKIYYKYHSSLFEDAMLCINKEFEHIQTEEKQDSTIYNKWIETHEELKKELKEKFRL